MADVAITLINTLGVMGAGALYLWWNRALDNDEVPREIRPAVKEMVKQLKVEIEKVKYEPETLHGFSEYNEPKYEEYETSHEDAPSYEEVLPYTFTSETSDTDSSDSDSEDKAIKKGLKQIKQIDIGESDASIARQLQNILDGMRLTTRSIGSVVAQITIKLNPLYKRDYPESYYVLDKVKAQRDVFMNQTGGRYRKHRFTHCKKHRHCRYCGKRHH
jgi:hypothetical protein